MKSEKNISTKNIKVPESIVDQVLGQEEAVNIEKEEKWLLLEIQFLDYFKEDVQDILKIQEKILMLIKKICADDFIATPEKNKCQYCDFRNICQYRV